MKKTIAALLCAGIICNSMLSLSPGLTAYGAESIPTVVMEESDALYYEVQNANGTTSLRLLPESQITGRVSITVHQHPVHVVISRQSSEGPVVYYETDLAPQEGTTATKYVFLLDYCELPQNPSHFDVIYRSDFLQGIYSSAYTVELSVPDSREEVVYTEDEMLVAYYHTETIVTGKTYYNYDVTFSETAAAPVTATVEDAVISGGDATLDRQIQLLWAPLLRGDVDNNGVIDILDAHQILLYYATQAATGALPDGANFLAADVDQDEEVTIFDAYVTLIYYARSAAGHDITMADVIRENQ